MQKGLVAAMWAAIVVIAVVTAFAVSAQVPFQTIWMHLSGRSAVLDSRNRWRRARYA